MNRNTILKVYILVCIMIIAGAICIGYIKHQKQDEKFREIPEISIPVVVSKMSVPEIITLDELNNQKLNQYRPCFIKNDKICMYTGDKLLCAKV